MPTETVEQVHAAIAAAEKFKKEVYPEKKGFVEHLKAKVVEIERFSVVHGIIRDVVNSDDFRFFWQGNECFDINLIINFFQAELKRIQAEKAEEAKSAAHAAKQK